MYTDETQKASEYFTEKAVPTEVERRDFRAVAFR